MSDKGRLYLCVSDMLPLGDTVATAGKVFEDVGKAAAFLKDTGLPIPDEVRGVAKDVETFTASAGKAIGTVTGAKTFFGANWQWLVPVSVGAVGLAWFAFRRRG